MTEANVATLRAGYEVLKRGDLSEVIFDEFRIEALDVTEDGDKLIAAVRQSGGPGARNLTISFARTLGCANGGGRRPM